MLPRRTSTTVPDEACFLIVFPDQPTPMNDLDRSSEARLYVPQPLAYTAQSRPCLLSSDIKITVAPHPTFINHNQ